MKGGYNLDEIALLKEKFGVISKKGWIEAACGGTGAIGLTFENELNKSFDSTYFPDFYGIEIKCTSRFSRFPYSLFSVAFDGPTFPEINRIVELYGYKDYEYHDKKVLKVDLSVKELNKCGKYFFNFVFEGDKLFMGVFNVYGELIEKKSFVYVDTLLNHLSTKLSKLVIIHASKKKINDKYIFRYYKLESFKLRDKELFIDLLKKGIIFATLESRVGKSGNNAGKYKNKNLVFKIKKEDLNELFDKETEINKDYNIDRVSKKTIPFYIMT